jgi:nuclear transport factor 2 (NTF2) superfamily protein
MHMSDLVSGHEAVSNDWVGAYPVISEDEAIAWLNNYKTAWETRDADAALALFLPEIRYRHRRFTEPLTGHKALKSYFRDRVMEHQRDISFDFELWGVKGNGLMARWHASFTWLPINGYMRMDGVSHVVFGGREDGRLMCVEYNEWYDQIEV